MRAVKPARELSQGVLLDDLPRFLADLARYIGEVRTDDHARQDEALPVIHALERLEVGYDLGHVVEEYAILREVIVTLFIRENAPAMTSAQMPRLHRAFDTAIRIAVERFIAARDRTIIAVDKLSSAFAGHEDPAMFLPEAVRLLREGTPAVDVAAILLREGDRLTLRALAGDDLQAEPGESIDAGECFAGRVAAARRPLSLRDAAHDPTVTSNLAPRGKTRALYGVPMMVEDEVIGVAVIGSSTTPEFSHEDQVMFRATVGRVSSLLVKARLREREREQRILYETLVRAQDTLGEGVTIVEGDRIVFANDAFAHVVGYPKSEFTSVAHFLGIVASEDAASIRDRIAQRPASGEFVDRYRVPIVRKDRRRVLLDVAATRIGTRTVIVSRDVTHEAEADRLLQDSEDRLRLATDAADLGVWERRPGQSAARWDARGRSLHGFDPGEETTIEKIDALTHPDDRERVQAALDAAFAKPSAGTLSIEYRIRRAGDGVERWISRKGRVFFDGKGSPLRILGTVEDVTKEHEARARLEEAIAFRDRMVAILAHDLRNPLNAIQLSAGQLRSHCESDAAASALNRVQSGAARIDGMVRDLVDFAQSRFRGPIPIAREDVELEQIVRQVTDELSVAHPGRIRLDLSGCGRGAWDPGRLAQMLSNLVSNALQYGSADAPVTVRTRLVGGQAAVSVHNGGEPIPPEAREALFEPFRRGAAAGRQKNLGLGLYIARQIALAHGGRIEVDSDAAQGTTFEAVLPLNAS